MNKDYRMAKFININGEYVAYTNESDLIELQNKEIERLNNIITELERYIEESKRFASGVFEFEGVAYMFYYNKTDDLLDKLKELKGSDKEWEKEQK